MVLVPVLIMVYAIVAHTDMDGVASAALYLYLNEVSDFHVFFSEPFLLHKTLSRTTSAYYEKVVIFDLGINPVSYTKVLEYIKLLREYSIPVTWFDHHIWEENWIRDMEKLGVELYIDRSTCTVGVVAKHLKPTRRAVDEHFVENLVRGVCAGDLWRFDHWLGGFYMRVVRRRDKDSWRKTVLKTLASGTLWSEDFNAKVEEHIDNELRCLSSDLSLIIRNINGVKLAVAESVELLENSFLASYIMGRYDVDIVVLASMDGKLSIRSRNIDVREVAYSLGGGGHMHAAGAKIRIPWWIKLLSRVNRNTLLHYVSRLIAQKLAQRRQ
ncbi:MAG: DHHA1 domain-containing protein [Desulfurococcaceae archaeon]